jgi:hypothetical protein
MLQFISPFGPRLHFVFPPVTLVAYSSTSGMRVRLSYLDLNQANRKGNNLYKMMQKCIILESNLEFERAKGTTYSKYLHSSTGMLSLQVVTF